MSLFTIIIKPRLQGEKKWGPFTLNTQYICFYWWLQTQKSKFKLCQIIIAKALSEELIKQLGRNLKKSLSNVKLKMTNLVTIPKNHYYSML